MTALERRDIRAARRVVVKVGSSSISGDNAKKIRPIVEALATAHARGTEVILVSSGAIATGMPFLLLDERPSDLATQQAAAAVGQNVLIYRYQESLRPFRIVAGQVLLTAGDLENPMHRSNARRAMERLLGLRILPIVNENDTVATHEIRFGDNDRLAALVGQLVGADALILLSDIESLYTRPPDEPGAMPIDDVAYGDDLHGYEFGSVVVNSVGTGGAATKVSAARLAAASGIGVLVTSADLVDRALAGDEIGTWFRPEPRAFGAHRNGTRPHRRRYTGRMTTTATSARERMLLAKEASRSVGLLTDADKGAALRAIADAIDRAAADVVAANREDLERGRVSGLSEALQDRLRLDESRVRALAAAVREIADLPDPVGRVLDERTLANGVRLTKVAVPFGVVGSIYEARPNVTVDIAALALRSGNAVVLRGGSAAERTNAALVRAMRGALADQGIDPEAIQTVDDFGRDGARELMQARGIVDVLVPRGSAQLIETVVTESLVPVIETGAGVVHIVLDESAPLEWARDIVVNAKTQRPSVCNAVETVLVHRDAASRLVPSVVAELIAGGVTVHGDESVARLADGVVPATDEDWATEYLSLDISMKVVDDLDDALEHIRRYSTHHTESIITQDQANAERFLAEVDSAVVMTNASTRFTDGGEFGFGAEVGISTQKLHARGPMGLNELTSTKWLARGGGQVRA